MMSPAPLTTEEVLQINDVLTRYATGIDSRDWDLFRSCFADDCSADYGDIGVWSGADEITEWMRASHDPCGPTLHRLTNVTVRRTDTGASARAYVDAIVMLPDSDLGANAAGYYDDELVRTDDGWKIATRRFTSVRMRMDS